jgi:hypothetical protein
LVPIHPFTLSGYSAMRRLAARVSIELPSL